MLPPGSATTTSTSRNTASTDTAKVRSRLAPISAEAAAGVPRGERDRKAAQREQADEHQGIVAEPPTR